PRRAFSTRAAQAPQAMPPTFSSTQPVAGATTGVAPGVGTGDRRTGGLEAMGILRDGRRRVAPIVGIRALAVPGSEDPSPPGPLARPDGRAARPARSGGAVAGVGDGRVHGRLVDLAGHGHGLGRYVVLDAGDH